MNRAVSCLHLSLAPRSHGNNIAPLLQRGAGPAAGSVPLELGLEEWTDSVSAKPKFLQISVVWVSPTQRSRLQSEAENETQQNQGAGCRWMDPGLLLHTLLTWTGPVCLLGRPDAGMGSSRVFILHCYSYGCFLSLSCSVGLISLVLLMFV